jgi:hypothetical protein
MIMLLLSFKFQQMIVLLMTTYNEATRWYPTNPVWNEMINAPKFNMKKMYLAIHGRSQTVACRTLFYGNLARPKALVNLWLACNVRLATRDILHKYGLINAISWCFCNVDETQQHLMFNCNETKSIWRKVLE